MNIIFEYLRRNLDTQRYFEILFKYNIKKVNKILKKKNLNSYLFTYCVNEIPNRSDSLNKHILKCNKKRINSPYMSRYDFNPLDSSKCINCWIHFLENIDEHVELNSSLPSFLKEKEIPKFLK
jgi:hypothetical protein